MKRLLACFFAFYSCMYTPLSAKAQDEVLSSKEVEAAPTIDVLPFTEAQDEVVSPPVQVAPVMAFPRFAGGQDAVSGSHRGAVLCMAQGTDGLLITGGEDGFLGFWSLENRAVYDRFQVSDAGVRVLRIRPDAPHLALVEGNDGAGYRVSAWNYESRQKLFSIDFRSEPAYINYSGAGAFLIITDGLNGIQCVDSNTGAFIRAVPDRAGAASLAITGKTERSMVSYMPAGVISYWDFSQDKEIQRVKAVSGLASPVLFGNNRFIAGIGTGAAASEKGLFVIDALTGKLVSHDPNIMDGQVYAHVDGSSGFVCVSQEAAGGITLSSFIADGRRVYTDWSQTFADPSLRVESAVATAYIVALGLTDGTVQIASRDGSCVELATRNTLPVQDIAVSSSALFALCNGSLFSLPLDGNLLATQGASRLMDAGGGYSRITAEPNGVILWSEAGSPRFVSSALPGEGLAPAIIDFAYTSAFPLRSVASYNNKVLFLNAAGEIQVFSLDAPDKPFFTFSSAGSIDADFLDDRNIIVGRGDGLAPFLKVSLLTGETVPLQYPAMVGVRVYRSMDGVIYGAVIDRADGNQKTALIRLNTGNPELSAVLDQAEGENLSFVLAESGGIAASNLTERQATLYSGALKQVFEQKGGFPLRIIKGALNNDGNCFISVDTDGVISWHSSHTGALLAQFRIYEDTWNFQMRDDEIDMR